MELHGVGSRLGSERSREARATVPSDKRSGQRDVASLIAMAVMAAGTVLFLSLTESVEGVYMAVHVVSATVWVGGGAALTIFAVLAERARDAPALEALVGRMRVFGERVFTPSSLLALASGIALVEKQGGSYGTFWIDFGLAVWAISFVTGALVIGPRSKRLAALIPERGLQDATTARALTELLRIVRFDTALLILVVVDMAAQPSF